MTYTIRFYHEGRPTGDELWTAIFGEAKAIAENALQTGAADRAEVLDEDGQLVFELPPLHAEDGGENPEKPKGRVGVTAQQRRAEKDRKRNEDAPSESDAIDAMIRKNIEDHGA